jgi:arylsulfatase A-like enzyme
MGGSHQVKKRFLDLAVAGAVLGTVQALVETLVFAWLHRDLLLAPYRFFPTHAYDAFAKLWFPLAEALPLPRMLEDFLGQGFGAKLALAPELVAINLATAVLLALVLAPLAGIAGLGRRRASRGAQETGADLARALAIVAVACVLVHGVVWAVSFKPPEAITAMRMIRAVARDVVQGGAGIAMAVLVVSFLAARVVLTRQSAVAGTVAAGLAVSVALAFGPISEATARVDKVDRADNADTAAAASPAAGYNVVLISIDSLRADHLGAYGYARDTSPTMDALARDGVLFRNSSSTSSWTLPAHMSLLTGRSLLGHGVVSDDRSLPASVGTVAETFQKAGYETHAIVSAPYVHSRYGFARGFDDYDDRTIYFETNEDSYRSVTAPRLIEAANEYLGRAREKPFFLFLHFWDVHYDYAPGAPYDRMFDPDYTGAVDGNNFYFDPAIRAGMNQRDLDHLLALYDGEIRLVDDHIAKLRAELARLGVADRTVFAIVADHGDEFFEHGNKGHHRTLYEEVIRTPFVLHVPGARPNRPVVTQEISLPDVGPTLLGLAGAGRLAGAEGRDFSGLYTGAPLPPDGAVYAELYRTGTRNVQVARIDARRKVIHHFQQRSVEVYDLGADPGEQRELPERGEVATPLVTQLRDWLAAKWHRFDKRVRTEGIEPVVIDEKEIEKLRSLGYLN